MLLYLPLLSLLLEQLRQLVWGLLQLLSLYHWLLQKMSLLVLLLLQLLLAQK